MFSTGLIVFRETLEAALFIGIIAAATRGLPGRTRWLACGVLAGTIGSLALAAGMDGLSALADGIGQDLVNVAILACALAMLAWHCVWVSTHSAQMVRDAARLGDRTRNGSGSLWALSIAVALSVLREGAETVLFVAGIVSGHPDGTASMMSSAAVGLVSGALAGVLIYRGLARIGTRHLFSVTNALVLVLAGSLASQMARALTQAGLLAQGSAPAWDTSALLSNDSAPGVLLHALAGYDASPSGLQVAFYVGTIALISLATRQMRSRMNSRADVAPAPMGMASRSGANP